MPSASTEAAAVLPICKSDCGVTVVITGGVALSGVFVSSVGEPTLAKFVNVPLAGAVTTTEKFETAFAAIVPKFQRTNAPFVVPPPFAETNVTLAGNVSVTTTLLAADGP